MPDGLELPGPVVSSNPLMRRLIPLALVVAACGPGVVDATTTTATTADSTTTTATGINTYDETFYSRQSPIVTDDMVVELEDGIYIGFLQWVTTSGMTESPEIQFDLAVWFSGDDAIRAAVDDGNDPPDGEVYYIRNLDPSEIVLGVSDQVEVISTWYHYYERGLENHPITFEQLAELWADPPDEMEVTAHLRTSPWWITIVDGEVVSINEQYLP